MARTPLLQGLVRAMRIARFADESHLRTRDAIECAAELEDRRRRLSRRAFLGGVAGAAVAASTALVSPLAALSKKAGAGPRIGIVGAGLGGLACAHRLAQKGYAATLYDANFRVGGRIASSHVFPGQVAEKGGELIDTLHQTLHGYVQELKLDREDYGKSAGKTFYYAAGAVRTEEEVVDEYRELVRRMRPDLQAIGAPTFYDFTEKDEELDWTDLATYLDQRAGDLPVIRQIIDVAYNIEYGLETHQQSCLNLLEFIHLDGRAKFAPFGVFSDERYHVKGGNDLITMGLAASLPAGSLNLGTKLSRLDRTSSGEYQLWFGHTDGDPDETADAVVLAIPFSVLKGVVLGAGLGLSEDKLRCINDLKYGTNTKTMIGFHGRPWWELHGCNGDVYAALPNVQNTWETNWSNAGATSILTDYSGGDRGRLLQFAVNAQGVEKKIGCGNCHGPQPDHFYDMHYAAVQPQADAFLSDLDLVLPGVKAQAIVLEDGKYLVERGHWNVQSTSLGSYTCPQPGYFTTLAGLEGEPAGQLKFAGEHADMFYEWQGYMEGAARSGVIAANQILGDIKAGIL